MQENLSTIVNSYKDVISKFKNRSDVLNGKATAYKGSKEVASFENTPKSIGDGLTTTGWCVSASEALLKDEIFNIQLGIRNAKAKLISIDIKEQHYGYCYNGSQNKWHTALLVEDSGFNIVIDITCSQFGDYFVGKEIWDLQTWCDMLRHPLCNHSITENFDNTNKIVPSVSKFEKPEIEQISLKDALHRITNINDSERLLLVEFFTKRIVEINKKLIIGNISSIDYKYINKINNLLMALPFDNFNSGYSVIAFDNKQAAKNWLKLYLEAKGKLPMYMLISKSVDESCKYYDLDVDEINITYKSARDNNKTYVVFEFGNSFGISSDWLKYTELLLPYGIITSLNTDNIYNGGKMIANNIAPDGKIIKETNTIYLKIDSFT